MPKSENQKLKILYIKKMLWEETDENHPLTVNELIQRLAALDIRAERKSVYADIATLQAFGYDIICERSRANKYFWGARDFELPELKIMVDGVVASKFITEKKSLALIKKLEQCTSKYQGKELNRQVQVHNRIKSMHEAIYYTVDKIHEALAKKQQIAFKYSDWDVEKKEVVRKHGEMYTTSPCALCWDNENYYLVTYSRKYQDFVHYRVDKMTNVSVLATPCDFTGMHGDFDINKHATKYFGMFSGKPERVTIYCDNSLAGAVIDRFGRDIVIKKANKTGFTFTQELVVSPVFFAWVANFGTKMQIMTPLSLRKEFKDYLQQIAKLY